MCRVRHNVNGLLSLHPRSEVELKSNLSRSHLELQFLDFSMLLVNHHSIHCWDRRVLFSVWCPIRMSIIKGPQEREVQFVQCHNMSVTLSRHQHPIYFECLKPPNPMIYA